MPKKKYRRSYSAICDE